MGQGQPRRPPARGNCCRRAGGECGGGGHPLSPATACTADRTPALISAWCKPLCEWQPAAAGGWPSAARLEAGAAATAC